MGEKHQILKGLSLALGLLFTFAPTGSQANSGASRSPERPMPSISLANEEAFYEYQCRRRPKHSEPQEEVVNVDSRVSYVNQSDAFGSASDQATFLAIYQMSVGPFGELQNSKEERNKLLQETSQAIDDCVNGRSCGEEKQKKVLKALVHLNQGLELRCMMLANQHNQNRLKTARDSEEEFINPLPATFVGTEFQYQKAANSWKYEKVKTETEMGRSYGTRDGDFFRLEENAVKNTILDKDREKMGESFIREYGIFIDNYTSTQREDHKRFYKFVPVGEANFAFADNGEKRVVDQQRFQAAMNEQAAKGIQSAVSGYKEKLAKARPDLRVEIIQTPNGPTEKVVGNLGMDPREVGMAFDAKNIPEIPEVNVDDLKKDGEFTAEGKPKAVVRYLNEQFRQTAEKQRQQRELASANDPSAPLQQIGYVNVTLNPEKFDQFLDEIWPTGEKREQQKRGIFPTQSPPQN